MVCLEGATDGFVANGAAAEAFQDRLRTFVARADVPTWDESLVARGVHADAAQQLSLRTTPSLASLAHTRDAHSRPPTGRLMDELCHGHAIERSSGDDRWAHPAAEAGAVLWRGDHGYDCQG